MTEPRYTYKASSPCFTIENNQPFVLQGCSCGWPSKSCARLNAPSMTEREAVYTADIHVRTKPGTEG